jgi:hypothetical protein
MTDPTAFTGPDASSATLEVAPLGMPGVTEPDVAPAPPSDTDNAIEAWFRDHFQGLGPRLDVEMYNVVQKAKEDLKKILAAL